MSRADVQLRLTGVGRDVRLPDGELLPILADVDLTVGAGEHVAVVGRSGSGKSTLLNVLGLLDSPTAGEYLLDGQDTRRLRVGGGPGCGGSASASSSSSSTCCRAAPRPRTSPRRCSTRGAVSS